MTFYLKYRPQKVAELDLFSVRRELEAILKSGRFSHAYLFSGPRGTGKTSAARILAKTVNCEKNISVKKGKRKSLVEPCNKCLSCNQITKGSSLDLIEIDAASNRGIDDIREIRERIKLAPAGSLYKVYIIDEVHMLTIEAFNALLKTLEEPPAHVLFVLCTTEPGKLPDTIISRCTRIGFPKASVQEVVGSLKKVIRREKLAVEKGVLEVLAQAVDGSFRDGMKYLEQLSLRKTLSKGKRAKITNKDLQEILLLAGEQAAREMLLALSEGNLEEALGLVSEMVADGGSLEQYGREILELLRKLLLTEIGVEKEEPVEGLNIDSLKGLIRLFHRATMELRTATIAELPFELAIIEWIGVRQAGGGQEETDGGEKHDLSKDSIKGNPGIIKGKRVTFSQVKKQWSKVLSVVEPNNQSISALLKAVQPKAVDNGYLLLEVAYPFHKEQLELTRYKAVIKEALTQVFSYNFGLRFTLKKHSVSTKVKGANREHENISGSVEDEEIIKAAEEIFGDD